MGIDPSPIHQDTVKHYVLHGVNHVKNITWKTTLHMFASVGQLMKLKIRCIHNPIYWTCWRKIYNCVINNRAEIPAQLTLSGKNPMNYSFLTIVLAYVLLTAAIWKLLEDSLAPCSKKFWLLGAQDLHEKDIFTVTFEVVVKSTQQPLYICVKVDRLNFSCESLTDVGILPSLILWIIMQVTGFQK